jgi:hypothetical protein
VGQFPITRLTRHYGQIVINSDWQCLVSTPNRGRTLSDGMEPTQRRFGVFSPLFDSEPGYLDLLHLDSPKGNLAVSRVIKYGRLSSDPFLDIDRLLDEENWRPHLVAAVALSVLGYNRAAFTKLWAAFDAGSWVTPQLAVVAYLRDPDFPGQARVRLEARCPVDAFRVTQSSPLERHLAVGPAGATERSAKAASALIYLLNLLGPSDWLTAELATPDLTALLSGDRDHASTIAEGWLLSLKTILNSLAIKRD